MIVVYILTLIFAAGHVPATQTIPGTFATRAECMSAGLAKKTADASVVLYSCSQKQVSGTPPPPPEPTPAPPGTHYELVIQFSCAEPDCEPGAVFGNNTQYDTLEACKTGGAEFLKPAANPTQTVKGYFCAVKGNVCP